MADANKINNFGYFGLFKNRVPQQTCTPVETETRIIVFLFQFFSIKERVPKHAMYCIKLSLSTLPHSPDMHAKLK